MRPTNWARTLAQIDVNSLRVVDGRIDIEAIIDVADATGRVIEILAGLETAISDAESGWLVSPVRRRLSDIGDEVGSQLTRSEEALRVLNVVPGMLGAEAPRTYFIAFTTPAEARGLGGFMGNWAEVTVTDGRMEMTDFGRTADLNDGGTPATRRLTGPPDFLTRCGPYLLRDSGQRTDLTNELVWSNLTMSPHFPDVAQVAAELYPQSGGSRLDGVVAMDVFVIARLLEITGPISLENFDGVISAENAVEFLLRDQYLIDETSTRVDLLAEVATRTVEQLLGPTLPAPNLLAELLGPMVEEHRLTGWAAVPEEFAVIEQLGMSGALPALEGADGLAVTIENVGNNKIDAYLEATTAYEVRVNPDNGAVEATLTLQLVNSAPKSGLPDVVIGNQRDLPTGTSFMSVSVFSPLVVTDAELDGKAVAMAPSSEQGYGVASTYLQIPSQGRRTLVLHLTGTLDLSAGYRLAVRSPPAARPFPISVAVDDVTVSGDPVVTVMDRSGVRQIAVGT
jgi:Protein of unknown function (DUF4012)